MQETLINFSYILASALFIVGIKMLGKIDTAKRGNLVSATGMFIAVAATLFDKSLASNPIIWTLIIGGIALGTAIGIYAAKCVKMTSMPEMVALLNGSGGFATFLVVWAEFHHKGLAYGGEYFTKFAIMATIITGGITATGSLYAYAKLAGKISGKAKLFKGQKMLNAAIAGISLIAAGIFIAVGDYNAGYICLIIAIVFSLFLGVTAIMPIGGGDMPLVIAMLNSLSGISAATTGFVLQNNVLVVSGSLVGASGFILSIIMCKAMNRTIYNVLFSGFGASEQNSDEANGEMKAISADDAYYILEAAQSIVFVPGYGMAVAQAQHAVKELGEILEANGADVKYAIHPVAGRMPGHMNVLLAEADVPYEQLAEMADVNPIMETVDVVIVIGANDVVNPAAANDKTSPIYGMPIIDAYKAKTVFALKRGQGAGFSGLVNTLFYAPNTCMIYGDAKATMTALVSKFKE